MTSFDLIISVVIIIVFLLVMYSGFKKQTLTETWEDIKEVFVGAKEKTEEKIHTIGLGGLKK